MSCVAQVREQIFQRVSMATVTTMAVNKHIYNTLVSGKF